jgi:hypothetical protein
MFQRQRFDTMARLRDELRQSATAPILTELDNDSAVILLAELLSEESQNDRKWSDVVQVIGVTVGVGFAMFVGFVARSPLISSIVLLVLFFESTVIKPHQSVLPSFKFAVRKFGRSHRTLWHRAEHWLLELSKTSGPTTTGPLLELLTQLDSTQCAVELPLEAALVQALALQLPFRPKSEVRQISERSLVYCIDAIKDRSLNLNRPRTTPPFVLAALFTLAACGDFRAVYFARTLAKDDAEEIVREAASDYLKAFPAR